MVGGLRVGEPVSEMRDAYEAHVARGGTLAPVPDGPRLECFAALDMAQAIESEVNRAQSVGHTKIRIDLTFDDASRLAAFMRRAVVAGA